MCAAHTVQMEALNCKDCFLSNSENDIWATLTRPSTIMGVFGHETISKSLITQQLSDHSPRGGSAYPLMRSARTLSCALSSAWMICRQDCRCPLNHSSTTPWRYFPSEPYCCFIVSSLWSQSLMPLQKKRCHPNSFQSLTACNALTTVFTVRGGAEVENKL